MAVIDVLSHGARKYDRWNWIKVDAWSRYYDAAQRHIMAWHGGETMDPDSGLPHLAHAVASLMFLLEVQALGLSTDDRPTVSRLVAEHGPAVGSHG